jgi:tRNA nucleotidyltransferase (CCA-adding enzyme)
VGATFPAAAVLTIAAGTPLETMVPLIQRFLIPTDPVAHPTPLLSGQELMAGLNLPPGPRIGHLLAAIQLARAEGEITTAEEALAWAGRLVEEERIKDKG